MSKSPPSFPRLAAFLALATLFVTPAIAQAQAKGPSPGTTAYPGRYPYTRADIDFITGMISHHAQALVMCRMAPTHGASPSVATLCERVINAQTDEISLFSDWLRDRNQPVPEPKPQPMKMMMNGVEHEMMMPGMLTDEQMKQLDAARGDAWDRLFLTDMIQHHRGAITMVNDVLAAPGAAQDDAVYKFASDIYADQSTEIDRMEKMLFTLPPRSK
jgi:uncharacterized protein (DUF305 family)